MTQKWMLLSCAAIVAFYVVDATTGTDPASEGAVGPSAHFHARESIPGATAVDSEPAAALEPRGRFSHLLRPGNIAAGALVLSLFFALCFWKISKRVGEQKLRSQDDLEAKLDKEEEERSKLRDKRSKKELNKRLEARRKVEGKLGDVSYYDVITEKKKLADEKDTSKSTAIVLRDAIVDEMRFLKQMDAEEAARLLTLKASIRITDALETAIGAKARKKDEQMKKEKIMKKIAKARKKEKEERKRRRREERENGRELDDDDDDLDDLDLEVDDLL